MSVGFHVSKYGNTDNICENINEAKNLIENLNLKSCVQIFVCNPKKAGITLKDNDIDKLKLINTKIYVHGSYIDVPWKTHNYINIIDEIKICEKINAAGLIIHLSNDANNNLDILKNLESNITLYLETHTARKNDNSFETPQKINELWNKISNLKLNIPIGICVDTAHLFASGCALDSYEAAKLWFEKINKDIPLLIHINDSGSTYNSGKDRHERLFFGAIWDKFADDKLNSGCYYIFKWAKKNNVDIILERDEESIMHDLQILADFNNIQ